MSSNKPSNSINSRQKMLFSNRTMIQNILPKKAKKCLGDLGMTPMIWPAQSPDLNPIEHLWNYLKARLAEYEEPAHSVAELWERVQEEWDKIPVEVCQNLIESMPRRLAAVVKAKGGYTKY